MNARTPAMLALALLLACTAVACAPAEEGRYQVTVVTEGAHDVAEGETLDGNLVVIGGEVHVAETARVTGDLALVSGNVTIDGAAGRDVLVVNGTLILGPQASVARDLTVLGGVLERDPAATVGGQLTEGPAEGGFPIFTIAPVSAAEFAGQAVATTVLMTLLAYAVTRLLPGPVARIARAVSEEPVVAGAVGLLVAVVVPTLLVMMIFTVLLIPVAMLGTVAFGVMLAYGLIALGAVFGAWLGRRLERHWGPARTAALGTAVLTLAVNVLLLVPLLGLITTAVSGVVALGAVFLTGFGRRVFVPASEVERSV